MSRIIVGLWLGVSLFAAGGIYTQILMLSTMCSNYEAPENPLLHSMLAGAVLPIAVVSHVMGEGSQKEGFKCLPKLPE